MGRLRKVPDQVVYDAVLALLAGRGEKAVTFAAVAERAGLAASSLADRHGSVAAMIADSREAGWRQLEARTEVALAGASRDVKGAVQLLKTLNATVLPDAAGQPARATSWRGRIEAELAMRLGGGARGRDGAAILFAVWYAQRSWPADAGRKLRLKDVLRRLGLD